jgi:hypothetical protein
MNAKDPKVFFITPPFTQLNTPYPATAYLKGFLNTRNISSYQADLGLEVILKLFSAKGLQQLFAQIENSGKKLNENGQPTSARLTPLFPSCTIKILPWRT